MSDITYKVNCGQRESNQVIHVDRIRLKRPQTLVGETADCVEEQKEETFQDQTCSDNTKAQIENSNYKNESVVVSEQQKYETEQQSCKEKELPARQFRSRRPPVWLKDYETDY